MVDAAVGSKAILGRAIESTPGLRGKGSMKFLNFVSFDLARNSKENASDSITGFGGRDKGTPGEIVHEKKFKYNLTTFRFLTDVVALWGKPALVADLGNGVATAVPSGGAGDWTAATVVFDDPTGDGGVTATGTVTIDGVTHNPSAIVITNPGHGYEAAPNAVVSGDGTGTITVVVTLGTGGPWLIKIRPGSDPDPRALSFYVFEGGKYGAEMQFGRRTEDIVRTHAADKRIDCEVTYTEATGDTIAGFAIAKTGNSGTYNAAQMAQILTRGRRPYDAAYDAKKSVFVKVIAVSSGAIELAATIDTAGDGLGGGFPGSYGSNTFTIDVPDTSGHDGWQMAVDSASADPIGLFGENNEPFEVSFGNQDLTVFAVDDEFEIPWEMAKLEKSVDNETRLSLFHFIRMLDGSNDVRIDSGSVKLMRPWKPYYENGRKLPGSIDATGDIGATVQFKKRLFDRRFRRYQEPSARFTLRDVCRNQAPIAPDTYEGIDEWMPQMAVTTAKSGDVPNKNTLEETITLEAEQPSDPPTAPTTGLLHPAATFDSVSDHVVQINIVTTVDPTGFLDA